MAHEMPLPEEEPEGVVSERRRRLAIAAPAVCVCCRGWSALCARAQRRSAVPRRRPPQELRAAIDHLGDLDYAARSKAARVVRRAAAAGGAGAAAGRSGTQGRLRPVQERWCCSPASTIRAPPDQMIEVLSVAQRSAARGRLRLFRAASRSIADAAAAGRARQGARRVRPAGAGPRAGRRRRRSEGARRAARRRHARRRSLSQHGDRGARRLQARVCDRQSSSRSPSSKARCRTMR